jgi:trigger factor
MNIVKEELDGQRALLRVTVDEADYAGAVEKTLREYRRKANIPGFRPGMVPMGMINKMYRKGVLAEQTYRLASDAAFGYIGEQKIDYVGDVLPAEEQGELDFDNNKEFEFVFELGLAPVVAIELSAKDKVVRYEIEADKEMYANYRANFLRRYGRLEDADKVEKDEALSVTLDNEHMNVEDAYVGLIQMDDKARKPFIGKKVGDTMDVNVEELYPTPSQRAAILKVREDELPAIQSKFKLTITKIRRFAEPELNGEFFATAFPDGSVTDEKGLETFVYEQIARDMGRETEWAFNHQVRKLLMEKAALPMPEAFLRRWLFAVNEGKFTMEQIDAEFPQFLDMMRWNQVQKYYAEKLELKVAPDDALAEAKNYAAMQFAQYGMTNVGDETLAGYAAQILQNKDEARKIYDRLFEQKVIDAVAQMLDVKTKKVSPEEFGKIIEKF